MTLKKETNENEHKECNFCNLFGKILKKNKQMPVIFSYLSNTLPIFAY